MTKQPFDKILSQLEDIELTTVHGRIVEVVGMLIKAIIPQVKMGDICLIKRDPSPDCRSSRFYKRRSFAFSTW